MGEARDNLYLGNENGGCRQGETLVTGPLPSKEAPCSVITGSFMLPENARVSENVPNLSIYQYISIFIYLYIYLSIALLCNHWLLHAACDKTQGYLTQRRGTTRAEDAQGTPTQSRISPSILQCTKTIACISENVPAAAE